MTLPRPTTLRVFPTRLAADRARGGDATIGLAHTTLRDLTAQLALPVGGRYVSPLQGRLILRDAARSEPFYRSLAVDPQGVRALHRAVSELRHAGIDAAQLTSVGDEAAPLARILAAYEARLAALGGHDDADQQARAVATVLTGNLPAVLSGVRTLVIEGGDDLFARRRRLFDAFAQRGVQVRLRLPYDASRAHAFAWLEPAREMFEERGAEIDVEADNRVGGGPLAPLRAAQFAGGQRGSHSDAPVQVLRFGSASEEAEHLAHLVATWRHEGVAADDIAIAVPDLDGLGRLVADALAERHIGTYLAVAPSIAGSARVRALLALVAAAAHGAGRDDLIEALTSADLWLGPEGARLAPSTVARTLWRSGYLHSDLHEAQEQLERLAAKGRGSIPAAATALGPLLAALTDWPQSAPLTDLSQRARNLWDNLGLGEGLAPRGFRGDPGPVERAALAARALAQEGALAAVELLVSLGEADRLLRDSGGASAWNLGELHSWLTVLAGETRRRVGGMRANAVLLTTPRGLVGSSFRRIILGGVDNNAFPRPVGSDPILTEGLRWAVNQKLGPALRQSRDRGTLSAIAPEARDQWLWLESLAAAEEELVVAFALNAGTDNEGTSPFVDELCHTLGREPTEVALGAEAPGLTSVSQLLSTYTSSRVRGATTGGHLARAVAEAVPAAFPERARALDERLAVAGHRHSSGGFWPNLGPAATARLRERIAGSVSTSALDKLLACRFQYLGAALLRLREEEQIGLELEPRSEGNAVHAALERVYRDIVSRGGLRAARVDRAGSVARIEHLVRNAVDEILREAVVHPALAEATVRRILRAVRLVVEADLDRDDELEPAALEHRFGEEGVAALVVALPLAGFDLTIRGRIDRVDTAPGIVRVIDFKRSPPNEKKLPRMIQAELYALAAAATFGTPTTRYETAYWGFDGSVLEATSAASATALAEAVRNRLDPRFAELTSGDIRADGSGETCKLCDLRAVCRHAGRSSGVEDDG